MSRTTLLMIGGGQQQVEAVLTAQRLGYRVLVSDRNQKAPCFSVADFTAVIDGRDIEALIACALQNLQPLQLAGVFTLTELVTSVAAVASATGLPGVSLRSAVLCQNKLLCKQAWIKAGIPTPQGGLVSTSQEATELFCQLAERVFVKPVVGFGGKGARKLLDREALRQHLGDCSYPLMMEQYLSGSMHDVNACFDAEGSFHPLGCFDRSFHPDFPVEIGACYPSQLSADQIAEMYQVTRLSAEALGICWGPVKADLVLTAQGFRILELAPRLHGPKGSLFLSADGQGRNHLSRILPLLAGEQTEFSTVAQNRVAICRALLPQTEKKYVIDGLEKLAGLAGVDPPMIFSRNGRVVEYRNATQVPGYLFAHGKTLDEAEKWLLKAVQQITYHYDN